MMAEYSEKLTIMIVDDTPANLDLLEGILSQKDYMVRAFPSGKLALRSAFSKPPDLILLDIKMPQMDGYEVCAQLKAEPITQDIPVLFISALQDTEDKLRAFELGGLDYITKPFNAAEVLARVKVHLDLFVLQKKLKLAKQEAEIARLRPEAADRAKSAFLSNVSHELRTPLNAVMGYAQLLGRSNNLDNKYRHMAEIINSSSEHLLTLLDDILEFSRIEAGRHEVHLAPCNIRGLMQTMADIFAIRTTEKRLDFSQRSSPSLPPRISTDEKRLRQIIFNLLGNAIKFTESGEIRLCCAYEPGYLHIAVSDTGIGIPEEEQLEVFQPFSQLGNEMYKSQGVGLGLAITRKLIDLMQGEIELFSRAGQGCTFIVSLPVQETSAYSYLTSFDLRKHNIVAYQRYDSENPYRILVIDNIRNTNSLLVDILEPLKFLVKQVDTNIACLEALKDWQPDLVFIALEISGMNSFETIQQLRKQNSIIPIIALSTCTFSEDRDKVLAAGGTEHLSQPIDRQALLACLSQFLKLDWYCADQERTISYIPSKPNDEHLDLPAGKRELLMELAKMGNMKALFAELESINEEGRYSFCAQELLDIAHTFDLKKLKARLQD